MKKIYHLLSLLLIGFNASAALYTTPGTGVKWTLNDLALNAGGNISFSGGEYLVTDLITINTNDTLEITTDEVVRFAPIVLFTVKGVLLIAPPTNVLFTAADPVAGFLGLRLDFAAGTKINKLTYEYANTMAILDCSPVITNSVFRYNGVNSNGTEGAINLFRSGKTIISNCTFLQNRRAGVQSGASVASAPQILNCSFLQNSSANTNRPQINLGTTGSDTCRIIGCEIIGGYTNSGGIGFLPLGLAVNAVINGNNIKGNRYGVVFNGGASINSLISYNRIEDNNIENNPNLGGSGINFTGSAAQGAQNSIVTGNYIARNLWGITIQGRTRPNIGNLTNTDTTDDGKNSFINNNNATTPGIDLYNNTVDPIFAMGNYWNTTNASEVEGKIFHQADNAALGLVTYSSFLLPVELISFTAARQNNNVNLQWKTAQEANSLHFNVEKSFDGSVFNSIETIDAAGNSNATITYNYTDANVSSAGGTIYYRLKMVDLDGTFNYSPVLAVSFPVADTRIVRYYPTTIKSGNSISTEIVTGKAQRITLQYFDANGKLLVSNFRNILQGFNKIELPIPAAARGAIMIRLNAGGFTKTISVIAQ